MGKETGGVASGGWRLVCGKCGLGHGVREIENGAWKMGHGDWVMGNRSVVDYKWVIGNV